MSASKLKNRRRFITRDSRLDIPEDGELDIPSTDGVGGDDETFSGFLDADLSDRTWPRRSWRQRSNFVDPFELSSSSTLPRFHLPEEKPQTTLTHSAQGNLQVPSAYIHHHHHHQQQQQQQPRQGGYSLSRSSSNCENGWRYRSPSEFTSSPFSSISSATSDICLESNCHEDAFNDVIALKGINHYNTPRDVAPSAVGSVPAINNISCLQTVSGGDTKRRSYSLNESCSYRPFFSHSFGGQQTPRPGSVLHRALAWEQAGRSQPLRASVYPYRSQAASNAAFINDLTQEGQQSAVGTEISLTGSGIIFKDAEPISEYGRYSRLLCEPELSGARWQSSPDPTAVEKFRLHLPTNCAPVQRVPDKTLRRSFDLGRSNVQPTNVNSHGVERVGSSNVSPVKEGRFAYFPTWNRLENKENAPNISPDSKNSSSFALIQGNLLTEPDNDSFLDFRNQRLYSDAKANTWTNGSEFRKPFRSKSLKLLTFEPLGISSTVNGKGASFQNKVTSPDSLRADNTADRLKTTTETRVKKPHLSMITLNAQSPKQNDERLRPLNVFSSISAEQSTGSSRQSSVVETRYNNSGGLGLDCASSNTRSARDFLRDFASTEGGLSTCSTRFATAHKVDLNSVENLERATSGAGPNGSGFVVRKTANLTTVPFVPGSKLEEVKPTIAKATIEPLKTTKKPNGSSIGIKPFGSFESSNTMRNCTQPPIRTEASSSASTKRTTTEKVSMSFLEPGKTQNAEIGKLLPDASRFGDLLPSTESVVKSARNDAVTVPRSDAKFTSAKELLFESAPGESNGTENSEKARKSSVESTAAPNHLSVGENKTREKNSSSVGGEGPTRLIRVFLKSSSQLKNEALLQSPHNGTKRVQIGMVQTGTVQTGSGGTDTDRTLRAAQFENGSSSTKQFSTKSNDVEMKEKITKPFVFSLDSSQKLQASQPLSRNLDAYKHPLTSIQGNNDSVFTRNPGHLSNRIEDQMESISRSIDADKDKLTKCVVGSNKCFLEIKSNDGSAPRKPFEIVKKKLIIPEPMPLLRPKAAAAAAETDGKGDFSGFNLDPNRKVVLQPDCRNGDVMRPVISFEREVIDESNRRYHQTAAKQRNSPTSQSVPTTLDRKTGGGSCATVAAAKCSDLEMALRKIETDMGIIANAGNKGYPNINKANAPERHNSSSTPNSKDISNDAPGTNNRRGSLFTYSTDCHKLKNLPESPGISTGASGARYHLACQVGMRDPSTDEVEYQTGAVDSSSVTTELDKAIAMLTSPKQTDKITSSPGDERTGGGIQIPHRGGRPLDPRGGSWKGFLSGSVSSVVRNDVPAPLQNGKQSRSIYGKLEHGVSPVSAHNSSSCASIEPVQVVSLSPRMVDEPEAGPRNEAVGAAATPRNKRWLVLAKEDSFDRPDSPMFRQTLPLPKDSVIMRHRAHQKELRCDGRRRGPVGGGGGGGGSLSSSSGDSGDDDEAPFLRLAPKRTKKTRNAIPVEGLELGESSDRNEERESFFSSSTSIRPLSVDSSILSEDNYL